MKKYAYWFSSAYCCCETAYLHRDPCAAEPATPAASRTIAAEEVQDAAAGRSRKVSLDQVEKSRAVTGDRLYGLAGLWLLIGLAILLIRYQGAQDDRKAL